MLDKIKAFAESVKSVILYILGPIAFVAGIIYYYVNKSSILEDQLKAKDGQEKLEELEGEQKEDDTSGADATAQYTKLRNEYLEQQAAANPDAKPSTPNSNPKS